MQVIKLKQNYKLLSVVLEIYEHFAFTFWMLTVRGTVKSGLNNAHKTSSEIIMGTRKTQCVNKHKTCNHYCLTWVALVLESIY